MSFQNYYHQWYNHSLEGDLITGKNRQPILAGPEGHTWKEGPACPLHRLEAPALASSGQAGERVLATRVPLRTSFSVICKAILSVNLASTPP